MADVLATAVRDRQRVPDPVLEIEYEHDVLKLDRKTCTEARTRARRSRRPHNPARRLFVSDVLDALTRQASRKLGRTSWTVRTCRTSAPSWPRTSTSPPR